MRRIQLGPFIIGLVFAGWMIPGHAGNAENKKFLTPAEICLSQEHGAIEESYQGTGGKLVVCIQDAHANEIAQQNISKIVQSFHKFYGMDMVGVEGSSGVVDTSLFEYFPGSKAKDLIGEFLLKQGKITGAELASIHTGGPLSLFGVEDPPLYLANYDSLVQSMPLRKNALEVLALLQRQVQLAIDTVYSPRQKLVEAHWQDFIQGKTPLSTAVSLLAQKAQENGISTQRLAHFSHYQQLADLEKALDLGRVDQERTQAVAALSKLLNQTELKVLTSNALRYREGSLSPLEFHRQILKLLAARQLAFASLASYAEYLEIAQMIDRKGLKHDMEYLARLVFEKIADRKDLQMRARETAGCLRLMDKFLRLRASREDYLFFQQEFAQGGAKAFFTKAAALCKEANVPTDLPLERADALQNGLDKAQAFYALAVRRDDVLASNLLRAMERAGTDRCMLLAGGFHTEGIARNLKALGISYVVVLPNVGNEPTEDRYVALLMQKDTPFLDVYRKSKKSDILSGAIGWIAPRMFKDESLALAMTSLFENLVQVEGFEALRADLQLEIVSALLAAMHTTGEPQGTGLVDRWRENLKKGLEGKMDPAWVDRLKVDEDFLGKLPAVQAPLVVSKEELYAPVLINGAVYVYHFYGPGLKPDSIEPISLAPVFQIGNLSAQVMDVNNFADALKARLGTDAQKPVLAGFSAMNPEVIGRTLDVFRAAVPVSELPLSQTPYPAWKRLSGGGIIAYDIDKVEGKADHLFGLAAELRRMKAEDPGVRIVLVSNFKNVQQNVDVLGLHGAYDALIVLDQEQGLMKPLLKRLSQVPETQKPVVLVTPRPDTFGKREADNKILDIPVIVPQPAQATTHIVSVPEILYMAKLVLEYQGDLDTLLALILKPDGPYEDLRKFLADNGVTDEASLRNALYNPMPAKVTPDAGKAVAAAVKFLESA